MLTTVLREAGREEEAAVQNVNRGRYFTGTCCEILPLIRDFGNQSGAQYGTSAVGIRLLEVVTESRCHQKQNHRLSQAFFPLCTSTHPQSAANSTCLPSTSVFLL